MAIARRPAVLGGKPEGLRRERILSSPRFVNGKFENTHDAGPGLKGNPLPTLGEFFFGGQRRVPKGPLPRLDPRPSWLHRAESGLRVTWLGHSTVLLEVDGFRVLTDPVWGARASPLPFAGPKRFHPVPVPLEALPELDAVLVSHDHYDHLCYPTIRELARRNVPFVTALGVGAHLEAWGVRPQNITELDWWEEKSFRGGSFRFTATPSQHFSGRGGVGGNGTLWASWVLESDHHKVFFSGDTGLTPEFAEVRARKGPFDLVMLEVGAFHPAWSDIHLGPDNAVKAFELLGGGTLLPVHWGTFNLAIHAWDEPAETLARLADEQRLRVITPRLGQAFEPSRIERIDPWWREVETALQPVEPLSVGAGQPAD